MSNNVRNQVGHSMSVQLIDLFYKDTRCGNAWHIHVNTYVLVVDTRPKGEPR